MRRFLIGRALLHSLFFLIAGAVGFTAVFLGHGPEGVDDPSLISAGPPSFFAMYFILLGLEFAVLYRRQLFSAPIWGDFKGLIRMAGLGLWEIFVACFSFCFALGLEFYSVHRMTPADNVFLVGLIFLALFLFADAAGGAIAWKFGQKKAPSSEEESA